jgi:hypothetical protein
MNKRFLVVSTDAKLFFNYDIVIADNSMEAKRLVFDYRPDVSIASYLDKQELLDIISAITTKSDEHIMNTFRRNCGIKSNSNTSQSAKI